MLKVERLETRDCPSDLGSTMLLPLPVLQSAVVATPPTTLADAINQRNALLNELRVIHGVVQAIDADLKASDEVTQALKSVYYGPVLINLNSRRLEIRDELAALRAAWDLLPPRRAVNLPPYTPRVATPIPN